MFPMGKAVVANWAWLGLLCLVSQGLAQAPAESPQSAAGTGFQERIPEYRPHLRYYHSGKIVWLPGSDSYAVANLEEIERDSNRAYVLTIELRTRLGRRLAFRKIEKGLDNTSLPSLAVSATGEELLVGIGRLKSGEGRSETVLQCYSLPELQERWEKRWPEQRSFLVLGPHGVVTATGTVLSAQTGDEVCTLPGELVTPEFQQAFWDGLVQLASPTELVQVSGMGRKLETVEGVTLKRVDLAGPERTIRKVSLTPPKRRRDYAREAFLYVPQHDLVLIGSFNGVIDCWTASTGDLLQTFKSDPGLDRKLLSLPHPTERSDRVLATLVAEPHHTRGLLVQTSSKANAKARILVADENLQVVALHPNRPLAFISVDFLPARETLAVCNHEQSTIDGAIAIDSAIGPGSNVARISLTEQSIWAYLDGQKGLVAELSRQQGQPISKMESGRVEDLIGKPGGALLRRLDQLFVTDGRTERQVQGGMTSVIHTGRGDRNAFFYVSSDPPGFNARRGTTFWQIDPRTGVGRAFFSDLSLGFPSDSHVLAVKGDSTLACVGLRPLTSRGMENSQDKNLYAIVLHQNFKQKSLLQARHQIDRVIWADKRLVGIRTDRHVVAWWDDPTREGSELRFDDRQIRGKVFHCVPAPEGEIVTFSEFGQGVMASLCGWDDEGLFVKRELLFPGKHYDSFNDCWSYSDSIVYLGKSRSVVATRFDRENPAK